jgi:transcriptional regulator with XRE-family HTH domain
MRREIPDGWLLLMEKKGLHSGRALAAKMGVSQETVQRMLHGEATSSETMERAADVLGVKAAGLWALRGETPPAPFLLPAEAERLTPKQRAAVVAVVRAMLEPAADEEQTVTPAVPLRKVARKAPPANRRT